MLLTVRRCGSQMGGKQTGMLTGVIVLCCVFTPPLQPQLNSLKTNALKTYPSDTNLNVLCVSADYILISAQFMRIAIRIAYTNAVLSAMQSLKRKMSDDIMTPHSIIAS